MTDNIKIVPFRAQRSVSIAALYSVPQTHVIYVGPAECARHNCRMNYYWGRMSFLCPSDADLALGNTEDLIFKAVAELKEHYRKYEEHELRGVILFTGCQTRFMSVDFEKAMNKVRNDLGIAITHFEESRFRRFDHASTQQTDLRISILRLMERQKDGKPGIAFLSDRRDLCSEQEYKRIKAIYDISWARSIGDCASFDEFGMIADSVINIVTSESMRKSAEYLKKEYSTPYIFLPPSVRIANICENYEKLSSALGVKDCEGELNAAAELYRKRISDIAALYSGRSIDIDLSLAEDISDILSALSEYGFCVAAVKIRRNRFPMRHGMRRAPGKGGLMQAFQAFEERDDEAIRTVKSIFPEAEILYAEGSEADRSHDFINGETIYGISETCGNVYGEMPSGCAQAVTPENDAGSEAYSYSGLGWGFTALDRFLNVLEKAVK